MEVPITKFDLLWYRCDLETAAWEFWQEAVIVAAGPISNLCLFLAAAIGSWTIRGVLRSYPKYFYKVVAWTGVFAILDPLCVLISDCASQNWYNGDMFKFFIWFKKAGDNGVVGAYLTFFMMITLTIFTGYFWYRFMIGVYMNGRILDLYRRLSGTFKAFFIPMDHEVSIKYLQWVITRAKKQKCVIMSEERKIHDKYGIERSVNFIQIMKIVDKDMLKMNRLFFKDFDGSIIEVPQKKIYVRTKELKHIKRQHRAGSVNVYGDTEATLATLCKNTNHFLRGNAAANLLANQEDGIGLELGGDSVIEEQEIEESPEK